MLSCSRPDSGLAVRDRKVLFTVYRASFSGAALVDWLISNMPGTPRVAKRPRC